MATSPTAKCQGLLERWVQEEKILRDIVSARIKKLKADLGKARPNIKDCERQLKEIRNLNDYIFGHIRATRIEVDRAMDSMNLIMEAAGLMKEEIENVQEW